MNCMKSLVIPTLAVLLGAGAVVQAEELIPEAQRLKAP